MKLAQTRVERGGWYNARPWFTADDLRAAEQRWIDRSYAHRADEDLQCGGCRFFAATGTDFGICANAASPLDGQVTFEHGGCDAHSLLRIEETPRPDSAQTDWGETRRAR